MKVYIIDAFTTEAFKGNPAGVCIVEDEILVETMQSIASELNLSETAFISRFNDSESDYSIRFFTPTVPIDFCGHATLAAAKVILQKTGNSEVNFTTLHNLKISAKSSGATIEMNFPLYDSVAYSPNEDLYDALGIVNPVATKYAKELDMVVIEVADKDALLKLQPDFAQLANTSKRYKAVIVTAKSEDVSYDFYSRCFCSWIGIDEDPVTGSSHSILAKYWSKILNKKEMVAFQASKRGGSMQLKIVNDKELEVISNAKIMVEGILNLE
ncbi:PhzF family phenazine biosynthesis protein [Flavobacterium ardleyense]|uniref:PhzF family phenazine biosynthesis protein n=1 Tax=Flavobacterium ardleyense TaxID=2038737 RepID=A0ABW5ZBF4_9FLAO